VVSQYNDDYLAFSLLARNCKPQKLGVSSWLPLHLLLPRACGFSRIPVTATVEIGANQLLAKLASDREKPDRLTLIGESEEVDFPPRQTVGRKSRHPREACSCRAPVRGRTTRPRSRFAVLGWFPRRDVESLCIRWRRPPLRFWNRTQLPERDAWISIHLLVGSGRGGSRWYAAWLLLIAVKQKA